MPPVVCVIAKIHWCLFFHTQRRYISVVDFQSVWLDVIKDPGDSVQSLQWWLDPSVNSQIKRTEDHGGHHFRDYSGSASQSIAISFLIRAMFVSGAVPRLHGLRRNVVLEFPFQPVGHMIVG